MISALSNNFQYAQRPCCLIISLRLNCQYLQCLITYSLDKLFKHSQISIFEKYSPPILRYLTFSFPMFPFDPPENIRKPFLMFSGGSKENIRKERVKNFSNVHHLCYSSLPNSPHAILYHPTSKYMMPMATLDSIANTHTHLMRSK